MKNLRKIIAVTLTALTLTLSVANTASACETSGHFRLDCMSCSCSESYEYGNHNLVSVGPSNWYYEDFECTNCNYTTRINYRTY